jgi:hypothetical protein
VERGRDGGGRGGRELLVGRNVERQLLERQLLVRQLLVGKLLVRQLVVGQLLVGQLLERQLVVRQLVVDRRLELITSRFDGPVRVGALGCLVAGLAAAIYALALTGLDAPGDLRVPWWTLVLVFGVAEASVVHLHFRSEAHSLSLSEAGLVFGLFFASPFGLISAQLAGGSLALLAFRRQRPLKVWRPQR